MQIGIYDGVVAVALQLDNEDVNILIEMYVLLDVGASCTLDVLIVLHSVSLLYICMHARTYVMIYSNQHI